MFCGKGRKAAAVILCAVLVLSAFCSAYAVTYRKETQLIDLGSITGSDDFDMWHYSGGYWLIGDNYNSWRWTDAQVGAAANIGATLTAKADARFEFNLPYSWRSQIQAGDLFAVNVGGNGIEYESVFVKGTASASYSSPFFTLTVRPRFNISSLRTFDDYVPGLKVCLPLINADYGKNLYAMFKGSSSKGRADGWFDDTVPHQVMSSYMHPSLIKNSSGALKAGYTVSTESGDFPSSGLSVGTGTFVNGGAVGLQFYFPVKLTFRLQREVTVADYSDEEGHTGGSGAGSAGGGQSGGGGMNGNDSSDDTDGPESSGGAGWRIHRYR